MFIWHVYLACLQEEYGLPGTFDWCACSATCFKRVRCMFERHVFEHDLCAVLVFFRDVWFLIRFPIQIVVYSLCPVLLGLFCFLLMSCQFVLCACLMRVGSRSLHSYFAGSVRLVSVYKINGSVWICDALKDDSETGSNSLRFCSGMVIWRVSVGLSPFISCLRL